MKSSISVSSTYIWLGIFSCLMACADPVPPPSQLAPIPIPDIEKFAPAIRQQLIETRAQLYSLRNQKDADPIKLGQLYGEQGRLYLAYELENIAVPCFINACLLAPQDYRWHYYSGYLSRSKGQVAESQNHFQTALKINPRYLPTYEALADLALEVNNLDEAESLFDQAHRGAPSRTSPRIGLGQIASIRGQYDKAIEILEAVRRDGRHSSRLNYWLGMSYRGKGQMNKARGLLALEGVADIHSYDPLIDDLEELTVGAYAFNSRGDKAKKRNQLEKALQFYRQAVIADPQVTRFRFNLATTLIRVDEKDAAVEQFEAILNIDPHYGAASYCLGVIFDERGQDEEAVLYYRQSLESNPKSKETHFNLAKILLRQKQFSEAANHFSLAVDYDPNLAAAYSGQALALSHLNRWQEAKTVLEKSHTTQPDNISITDALARLLAACPLDAVRNGSRALKLAQQLDAQKRTLLSRETLAMALAEVGRFQDAVRLQNASLKALEQVQNSSLKIRLETNLKRYAAGRPCRRPF